MAKNTLAVEVVFKQRIEFAQPSFFESILLDFFLCLTQFELFKMVRF